ncbi:MAG: ExeM/NucH family extracellular endonuclease [Trueperaceae bacterium]
MPRTFPLTPAVRTAAAALAVALATTAGAQATPNADACTAPFTPTYVIQGTGPFATTTDTVTTRGVVVGDYEGRAPALRGFYVQDPDGDGDPATSDGLFVYQRNADEVALGDLVVVTGLAGDFQGQTQVRASSVTICATDRRIEPVEVTLPVPDPAYLDRYEGMLVRFPQTLTVTETYQLGRFGQVTLAAGGRLPQPTAVALPGPDAAAIQAANDLARIVLDDDQNDQNPDPILFGGDGPLTATGTLRSGATVTGLVGVLAYTWAGNQASPNTYRLRTLGAMGGGLPTFVAGDVRPPPPAVPGEVRVASLNVLNYFTTLGSRGAQSPEELDRQAAKLVATFTELDADVVGLMEIENGPDALADLVARLNAATEPGRYAGVDAARLGEDEIKVALVYQPARVGPVGEPAVLDDAVDRTFGSAFNRPMLAQSFADARGEVFTVVVTHLKSKGSPCPGAPNLSDGQGECNRTRVQALEAMLRWLAADPTGVGDPDVLLVGDLNAYQMEDPVRTLVAAGYVDLHAAYAGPGAYTYVFDGQWGALDYAFASPTLRPQVAGAAAWHANADEPTALAYLTRYKSAEQIDLLYDPGPYRASDHDPVVVGLDLGAP